MINREYQPVDVITFATGIDSYGQKRTSIDTQRTVDMVCKIYVQYETQSPIFNDVEMIGITKDHHIFDNNQIKIGDTYYNVIHTIPSGQYLQVLMKKVK